MKLYFAKGTCALAVRITLHELNIPCDYEAVNIREKKTSAGGDFWQINPKGVVPVLELDSGERLTENVAIQLYLADTFRATQLLPALGEVKRYHVIEWLSYVSTDMHKSFTPLFLPTVPLQDKENIFIPVLKNKLNFLEMHFKHHNYLLGEHYMLPDGYLYVVLTWLDHFKVAISEWPELERYFYQIQQRDSVQKSLAEGG